MTTAVILHSPARRRRALTVWGESQGLALLRGTARSLTSARISVDVRDRRIRLVLARVFGAGTTMFIPGALARLHRLGTTPLCGGVTLDLTAVTYLDHAALRALGDGALRLARAGWHVNVLPPREVPDLVALEDTTAESDRAA